MNPPPRTHFDGTKFDLLRASVTTILYISGIALGMSRSFLYGGGLFGAFPLLLAFFIGPWIAAWITCKLLRSQRRRLVLRLACGIYAGYFVGWMVLGLTSVLMPKWPDTDPRTRFMARHDAALVVVPLCIFLFAGTFALSRWRSKVPV